MISGEPSCTLLFMTGVILPFMNSAFDPVIFIIYNAEMSGRISFRMRALICGCCRNQKRGVRFNMEPRASGVRVNVTTERRAGSMCVMKRWEEPDVIEYKDSDVESDSSLESFEYKAKKHKSRRYR